jgi:hypothetical protein
MTENNAEKIYHNIEIDIQDNAVKELWYAIKSELIRPDGGPTAVKEYLDSEAIRLNQIIEQSLEKFTVD